LRALEPAQPEARFDRKTRRPARAVEQIADSPLTPLRVKNEFAELIFRARNLEVDWIGSTGTDTEDFRCCMV
jgi:hypothetical protein